MKLDDLSRWARGDGLQAVLLALGAVLLTRFVHWTAQRIAANVLARAEAASRNGLPVDEREKHRRAVIQALERTAIGLVWFVTVFMILIRFRVPVTTLVAPATVAGVALGFGAQRIVQDLLAGFFLVSEDQYGVGDVVQVSPPGTSTGITGTVETISLRTTRLRTNNGELVVIPNGEIRQVTNRSRDWSQVAIDVPVDVSADLEAATNVLRDVASAMAGDDAWTGILLEPPTVVGVESIEIGYAKIRMVARTLPARAVEVGRELRRRALISLRTAGFETAKAS